MKRLAWMLILGLLGLVSPVLAYDGPGTPINYDRTLNGIRVQMLVDPIVLKGGVVRVRNWQATVPLTADTTVIQLELRRSCAAGGCSAAEILAGYEILQRLPSLTNASCTAAPTLPGPLVATCGSELFLYVPQTLTGSAFDIYPYVRRNATSPANVLVFDGSGVPAQTTILTDDLYEPNNSSISAYNLGTASATPLVIEDLAWNNQDWFRVTMPAGAETLRVRIDFWHKEGGPDLSDLDLWAVLSGTPLPLSAGSGDSEEFVLSASPGDQIVFYVEQGQFVVPAFYDLTVQATGADVITVSDGPEGNPNPVQPLGTVNLSVTASDSVGHDLDYFWSQSCQGGVLGSWVNREAANAQWIAPANNTGGAITCNLTVQIDHVAFPPLSVVRSFPQIVAAAGDSIIITQAPNASPNTIDPLTQTTVSVAATDALGHPLVYTWNASCPIPLTTGAFTPVNGVGQSVLWQAPNNATGVQQSCTLTVTIVDNQGLSVVTSVPGTGESLPAYLHARDANEFGQPGAVGRHDDVGCSSIRQLRAHQLRLPVASVVSGAGGEWDLQSEHRCGVAAMDGAAQPHGQSAGVHNPGHGDRSGVRLAGGATLAECRGSRPHHHHHGPARR